MANRTYTVGGRTYTVSDKERQDAIQEIATKGYRDYSKVVNEVNSLTNNQRAALEAALINNESVRRRDARNRPEDTAIAKYIEAIKEITREDGTVPYGPKSYRFNVYSDGVPDANARKAYDSLSYKDQLLLDIDKKGKPVTPDFGDPNVDTSVYDRYQQALAKIEQDAIDKADADAVKAIEDAYRNNRGNYEYDPKEAARAIKEGNKQVTYTQSELVDIYEGLQSKYDWDDEAYAVWSTPAPASNASRKIVATRTIKREDSPANNAPVIEAQGEKNKLKPGQTLEQLLVQWATPKNSDKANKVKANAEAANNALGNVFSRWGSQYSRLTGRDDGEQAAKSQFATDAVNVYMSSLKGATSAAGDVANAAAHTVKEANALYRKWVRGDDSEIKEGEFAQKYPITGYLLDAAFAVGDAADTMESVRGNYLKASTGNTEASRVGKQVANVAETVSNSAARMFGAEALAPGKLLNLATYAISAAGGTYDDMLEAGNTKGRAAAMAAWNAVTEGIVENYTDKVLLAGGKGIKSVLNGIIGNGKKSGLIRAGAAKLNNKYGVLALRFLTAGGSEGAEEYIQYFLDKAGRRIILGDTSPVSHAEALKSAAMGMLCGTIFAGMGLAGDTISETTARTHAEKMATDIVENQQTPPVEETIQLAEEVAAATAETPITSEELDAAESDGLALPEAVKTAYKQAAGALTASEGELKNARVALQEAQASLPFGDPTRVEAVKRYTDAVKARNKAGADVEKAYGKLRQAVDTTAAEIDAELLARAQAYAEQDNQLAQYQFDRNLQNDPEGMMQVLAQQEAALTAEMERLQVELDALPAGDPHGRELFAEIQQLGTAIDGIKQTAAEASPAIAPTIAEEAGSEQAEANVPAVEEAPAQETPATQATSDIAGNDKAALGGMQTPDFSKRDVKWDKAAAHEWIASTENAGVSREDMAILAEDRQHTARGAKERAFWANVANEMTGSEQSSSEQTSAAKKPKVMAFKPTPQQETAEDVVKALDADSPYAAADSTDMKYEPSSYEKVRKPSSIKSDIQNILGFRFSDEHFRRDQRKAGAVAYYEPATKFVVSGDTNNLPAFLHDAGHHVALEQYAPDEVDVFKQMVPRKFLDEYPAEAQTAEAASEMFRAWVMNPDKMERTFPETFEGMKRTLGNAKYAKLRNQSSAIRAWFAADTQQKVSSVHRTTRDQEKANKEPAFSKFIKREADSAYGYKVLDRAMERAGVTLASSADARASCARTSSEAIHALLFDGIYDPNTGKKVCCGLVDTTKGLVTTATEKETLEVYLTLKQSYERYEHNKKDWTLSKNVCTPAEAKAYIDNVENHQPNIHRAAQNIWEYLKNYRHTNLSSAIPQSVIDKWDEQNKYYIPQTRVFTNNIRSAIKGGGVSGSGTGVNRRGEGSTRDFLAPSDAIVQMITKTKTAALKHETLKTLQEYYDADQTGTIGNYIHEVEPGVYITPVDGSTVTDATMKALSKGELDAETLTLVNDILEGNSPETVVFRYGDPNGRKNNIVAITENGHTRYFEVMDQDLMDAVAPMSKQQLNSVFEAISKVQRMTSSLITSNNPFFATSNAIRDFVTGYVTGSEQNPFKYTRDYVGAAIDVAKDAIGKDRSGVVAQYRAMGGGGGLAQSFATADNVNAVTSAMYGKAGDNRIAIKRSLDKVGSAIQAINGGVETIPRLAEYKRQLAAGASYPEAIKAAKNVTTDFSTSGTHSKIMSTVWRFYGAQVNGLYKTYNLFADGKTSAKQKQLLQRRMGALAGTIAASTLIHFLNYIFDDDDEYAALPDYIKEGYYIFPAGKPGKFIRIPKPNDPLLVVTDSIARNITDAAMGVWREGADAGDAIRQEAGEVLGDLITALLPIGEVNTANPLGSNFIGNAALQWANNKTWTGATVVPKSMEGMSAALQYDDDTSWVSKMIGKVFNISPMKLDNFLDQNTGVIGEVSDAVSEGIETGKQEGIAKGVAAGFKEAFLSRFLVDSAYSQGVTSSFYDMKGDLQRLVDDVEYSIEMGDGPYSTVIKGLTPQQTGQASKEAEARLKTMNEVAKQLKELGQLATKAEASGDKEKARQYRLKQQELAATAALEAAEFFDKWKSANK